MFLLTLKGRPNFMTEEQLLREGRRLDKSGGLENAAALHRMTYAPKRARHLEVDLSQDPWYFWGRHRNLLDESIDAVERSQRRQSAK